MNPHHRTLTPPTGRPVTGPARGLRHIAARLVLGLLIAVPWVATAAPLSLSTVPLFLTSSVNSNLMFVIDTSGGMDVDVLLPTYNSMYYETGVTVNPGLLNGTFYLFPDPARASLNYMLEGDYHDPDPNVGRARDYTYNTQYYDPNVTYAPWLGTDNIGNALGNASPTAALWNPYNPAQGSLNLTQETANFYAYAYVDPCGADVTLSSHTCGGTNYPAGGYTYKTKLFPATYYLNQGGVETRYNICDPLNPPTGLPTGQSCATSYPNGLTYAQELQNFANWFQYYRTPLESLKGALGQNIPSLTGMDVGMTGLSTTAPVSPVASMSLTANQTSLTQSVYAENANLANWSQPFHERLYNMGKYFAQKTTVNGVPPPIQYSCQQNFVALVTPGYLNDPGYPQTPANAFYQTSNCMTPTAPWENPFTCVVPNIAVGNYDGNQGVPYADLYGDTLADWAAYYYAQNLRPDLTAGQVPIPPGSHETNTNPHFDVFALAPAAQPVLETNPPHLNPMTVDPYTVNPSITWPQPVFVAQSTIDDLWHSAVDARGQFLNTSNIASGLQAILSDVTGRSAAAAAVALNSGSYTANSALYEARFTSSDWSGQLLDYPINPNGTVATVALWDAGQVINGQNWNTGRQILTYSGTATSGEPFRWSSLDATEQTDLNTNIGGTVDGWGALRLNYLRGDSTNEGVSPYDFRARATSKLGDIINSAPLYVGPPDLNYPIASYTAFTQAYANRAPVIYAGANDGMMHAFNAATGQEMLAYVPRAVYGRLSNLTSTSYAHQYFVDGSPTAGDVEFSNSTWHTVLVSGLGAGGRGVFGLDITDPTQFSEANAASTALWEFDSTSDADLGYTFSEPTITEMANGVWAAVFGNGYNSTGTGHAILYVVNVQTGAVIAKIDTGVGSITTPNGLSTPAVVDSPGTNTAAYVYAGDLDGNLWKFDVTATNPAQWAVAYKVQGKPAPLYSAVDGSGNPQPITSVPQVGSGPSISGGPATGDMVYFGTGTYFQASDNTNTSQQSFYGIWDDGAPVPNRTANPTVLVQQTVTTVVAASGNNYRVISSNPVNYVGPPTPMGWFLDLPTTGERSVTAPLLRNGRVIFTTTIPSTVACSYGGDGWLMELDAMTGGQLTYSPFDTNNDGTINSSDALTLTNGSSAFAGGVEMGSIASQPAVLPPPNGTGPETKYLNTSKGTVVSKLEAGGSVTGPVSWQQIR